MIFVLEFAYTPACISAFFSMGLLLVSQATKGKKFLQKNERKKKKSEVSIFIPGCHFRFRIQFFNFIFYFFILECPQNTVNLSYSEDNKKGRCNVKNEDKTLLI